MKLEQIRFALYSAIDVPARIALPAYPFIAIDNLTIPLSGNKWHSYAHVLVSRLRYARSTQV